MKNHTGIMLLCFIGCTATIYPEHFIEPAQPVVNQVFKVKLKTARITSYDWYFKGITQQVSPTGLLMPQDPIWAIKIDDPTYSIKPHERPLRDETKIFRFKACKPGKIVLLFQKKHRYKYGKKVIASKEVTVTIREKQ